MVVETVSLDASGITVPQLVGDGGEEVASLGIIGGLIGAGVGLLIGGPGGALAGAKLGFAGGGGSAGPECPPFTIKVGDNCVDPLAALPGGRPAVTRATGTGLITQAEIEEGIFGLLSTLPDIVGEINGKPVMRCPVPGLVLGKDNRCYSRKDLPAKLRKWPPHRCKSATDRKLKAIKDAGSAAKSLAAAFKGSGYKITKTGK